MFLALRPSRRRSWTAGPFTPDARHLHRYRRRQREAAIDWRQLESRQGTRPAFPSELRQCRLTVDRLSDPWTSRPCCAHGRAYAATICARSLPSTAGGVESWHAPLDLPAAHPKFSRFAAANPSRPRSANMIAERTRAFDEKVESMMGIPTTARIGFKMPTGTKGPVMNGEALFRRFA